MDHLSAGMFGGDLLLNKKFKESCTPWNIWRGRMCFWEQNINAAVHLGMRYVPECVAPRNVTGLLFLEARWVVDLVHPNTNRKGSCILFLCIGFLAVVLGEKEL